MNLICNIKLVSFPKGFSHFTEKYGMPANKTTKKRPDLRWVLWSGSFSRVGPASVALSPPSPGPVAPGRQMNEERRKVRVFGPGLSLD